MLMIVKYAGERHIALPELMFWRQAGCLPVIVGWLAATGKLSDLRTKRIGAHSRRALLGTGNMVLSFGSFLLLPLAEATTLGFTAPLFAVLIAAFYFREKVGRWRWSAVLLGFIGVLIVSRPSGEAISTLGASMALVCALVSAVINYQIRDLGKTEAAACTVFWFAAFGTLLLAPVLPFVITRHTPFEWLMMVGLGLFGALGQLLMTASLRYAPVTTVIIMDYTALIWATFYGWLVWNHFPPIATFLGAPLIIGSGAVIAWREHRLARDIAVSAVQVD